MRAFTVYQPYAYAIVAGLKGYETRPRRTNIRGRVAVHAGKASLNRATRALSDRAFWELLGAVGGKDEQPLGAVVGTVEIVDCLPVEEVIPTLTERERALGDYSPGRWAWVLKNPVMFDTPIPASGKQGWWNWTGALRFEQEQEGKPMENGHCGRPEWADEEGCPMDNPNEEMEDCTECRWRKETEGQE